MSKVVGAQDPNVVNKGTWGHMAPVKGKMYNGVILFTYTDWGNTELITFKFEDDAQGEVSGGPWLFEEVSDLVEEMTHPQHGTIEDAGVYRWCGTYLCRGWDRRDIWKCGKFKGLTEKIKVTM